MQKNLRNFFRMALFCFSGLGLENSIAKYKKSFLKKHKKYFGLRCRHGVVVITTAQLHSKNPEFGFCTGSNPACSKSEIQDGRNLCQWSRLEIWLDTFRWLTIPQKQFIITRNIRKHFFPENHKKSFQAIFFNSFFFFFFFFWVGGGGGGRGVGS